MIAKLSLLLVLAAVLPAQLHARDSLPFPDENAGISEPLLSGVEVKHSQVMTTADLQSLTERVREEAKRTAQAWKSSQRPPFSQDGKKCGYSFLYRTLGMPFQCVSYDVPVHWHDLLLTDTTIADLPKEDKLQLFTRRFGNQSPDAVKQLHIVMGGPGEAANRLVANFMARIFNERDTQFFFTDHRGTGESNPLKKNRRRYFHGRDIRKMTNGLRMPGDKKMTRFFRKQMMEYLYALQDTPNHRGFNMINAVLDKIFVVQLFKSYQESLLMTNPVRSSIAGFSYGSQLAQNVLALVPRGLIHSIVLVSVPPPKMEPALLNSHGVLDSMQAMLDSCHQSDTECPIPIESSLEFGRALDRISENQCGLRLRQQLVRHKLAGSNKEALNQFLMTLYRAATMSKKRKEILEFRAPMMVLFYRLIRCDTEARDDKDAVKALTVLGYFILRSSIFAEKLTSLSGMNMQLNFHQTAHACDDELVCELPGIAKPASALNQFSAYLRQHKLVGPVRESIDLIPPIRDSDAYCVGLQGMLDPLVSYKQAKETFKDMECARKTFSLLPSEGHGLLGSPRLAEAVNSALQASSLAQSSANDDYVNAMYESMDPQVVLDWSIKGKQALEHPEKLIRQWKSLLGWSQRWKRWYRNKVPGTPRLL